MGSYRWATLKILVIQIFIILSNLDLNNFVIHCAHIVSKTTTIQNNEVTTMAEDVGGTQSGVGKDACDLTVQSGSSKGYYPYWFYKKERMQCVLFIYGGRFGNNNRFETRDKCMKLCAPAGFEDVCQQPKDTGPCKGSYERWYFNSEFETCERFIYGGCKGNENNFNTQFACDQKCFGVESSKGN